MKLGLRFRFYCEYIPFLIGCVLFRVSSDRVRSWLAGLIGNFFYYILPLRKQVAYRNIRTAFADLDSAGQRAILYRSYQHCARFFAEFTHLSDDAEALATAVDGSQVSRLEAIYSRCQSAIIVTGHIGVWEIGGLYLNLRGLPVTILVKKQKNPLVAAKLDELRWSSSAEVINRTDGLKYLIRAVKDGKIPIMVGDQDGGVLGARIPVFGHDASVTRGFALLSRKYKIPVVPVFAVISRENRITMLVEPEIQPDYSLPEDEFISTILNRYTAVLEQKIREYPEQYFWFHKRWKTFNPELYQ